MICNYCKTFIDEGTVLCPICGKAVQIVPDYNPLDDEVLSSMIEGKKPAGMAGGSPRAKGRSEVGPTSSKDPVSGKHNTKKKSNIKGRIILIVVLLLVAVGLGVFFGTADSRKLEKARVLYNTESYEEALALTQDILSRHDDNAYAFVLAGQSCYKLEDYENAKEYLFEAMKIDPSYDEAYEYLLYCYQAVGDEAGLKNAGDLAKSDSQKKIYEANLITRPEFSEPSGEFSDDVEIELSSAEGFDIYYTLNGTDPTEGGGKKYKKAITIKDGETTVKAACKNNTGKFSAVVEETYKVTYEAPAFPVVSPMTGVYHTPTKVTIISPIDDGRIYYTWNGTTPTASSSEYTAPIDIPEGDNILSVIVIDKHDLSSEVLRCSFSYLPAVEEEEDSGDGN